MDKYELKAIIESNRRDSLGYNDSELSTERATALDLYYGREYGNEEEGYSKIVSKDISEAVDWALPALLKMFVQSGNIAEFEAIGPEDEERAEQESDYVNHVIMDENNGFLVLHDAFKDALILKNGYFKHFWEENETVKEEEYDNLSEDDLLLILNELEGEVEVKEQEVTEDGYHVKFKITKKTGKVCIEATPPEELRISKRARSGTQDAPFIEHVTRKTRSELVEMGMSKDFVDGLSAYTGKEDTDSQTRARDTVSDESDDEGTDADRSMDEIEYCEAYLKVDFDGDKVAELRKVVIVGGEIPEGDDWNEQIDRIPFTSITPKRVPHRHIGESLVDDLEDLQEIKTALERQLMDNIYATNHNQYVVNERAYLEDFLVGLPGGVKRITDSDPVDGSFAMISTPPILDKILPAIDYIDSNISNRTGINEITTGLDPDVLKMSTEGAIADNVNRASQKVEMIGRLFAEGVRELVIRVHELEIKHQDQEKVVKLRGKYVPVNPQKWKERTDVKVTVGIGTGNEEEKRNKLSIIHGLQNDLKEHGLVNPSKAYNLFSDLSKSLGYEMPERYVLDPQSQEYQQYQQIMQGQQQPNPLAEAEKVKGEFALQSKQMEVQFKGQIEQAKRDYEAQLALMKYSLDTEQKEADRRSKEAIEAVKLEVQAIIEGHKIDLGKPGIGAELESNI